MHNRISPHLVLLELRDLHLGVHLVAYLPRVVLLILGNLPFVRLDRRGLLLFILNILGDFQQLIITVDLRLVDIVVILVLGDIQLVLVLLDLPLVFLVVLGGLNVFVFVRVGARRVLSRGCEC